jgi:hypothetical protein
LNIILAIYFGIFDTLQSVINLELATIGSLAILSATYFGYKKLIDSKAEQAQIHNEESDEEKEDDEEYEQMDEKPSAVTAVTSSYKGYLFPMRIAAYSVFAASFVYLSTSGSLKIAAFFAGLSIAPISIMIALFWIKQTKNGTTNE